MHTIMAPITTGKSKHDDVQSFEWQRTDSIPIDQVPDRDLSDIVSLSDIVALNDKISMALQLRVHE